MTRRPARVPDVLAAVDLGSNSFHLVVAQYRNGQLVVIDRLREPVQLAAGLDDDGRLDKEVTTRALACLKRFGQRISEMHASGGEPNRVDRVKQFVPMKRGGTAEEVAAAILWLLSDEASYTTGGFIDIAGGK